MNRKSLGVACLIFAIFLLIFGVFLPKCFGDSNVARSHIETIKKLSDRGVQVIEKQADDLAAARRDAVAKDQENQRLIIRNDELEYAWFTPIQKRWILYVAIAIFVLRGIGLLNDGMLGTIASGAAHGLLGIATSGISFITTVGDNLWFRIVQPKSSRGEDINEPPSDGHLATVEEPTQDPATHLETM